jgi:hypothetical protein
MQPSPEADPQGVNRGGKAPVEIFLDFGAEMRVGFITLLVGKWP